MGGRRRAFEARENGLWKKSASEVVIGRGATATVLLAKYNDKEVALKNIIMSEKVEENQAIQTRLKRELRIVGKLHHPCIPVIFGACTNIEQGLFVLMEYIKGTSLKEACNGLAH